MKFVVIVFIVLFVTYSAAAPNKDAEIIKYENENTGNGGYRFSYETSDGTSRTEEGELKNVGAEDEAISVIGSVTWTAPDGQVFTLKFVADENGYRPEGDFLPKAPTV